MNKSEIIASQAIQAAFARSFDDFHIFMNLVIPLPAGRHVSTAEMDCVVVCNAGVIVFEVKGWDKTFVNRVEVADQVKKQWVLQNPDGTVIQVADPVSQGGEKMIELRHQLPGDVFSQYYVCITGTQAQLSGKLPSSVITLSELQYVARHLRSSCKRSKKSVELDGQRVRDIASSLLSLGSHHTLEEHVNSVIASKAAAVRPVIQGIQVLPVIAPRPRVCTPLRHTSAGFNRP